MTLGFQLRWFLEDRRVIKRNTKKLGESIQSKHEKWLVWSVNGLCGGEKSTSGNMGL